MNEPRRLVDDCGGPLSRALLEAAIAEEAPTRTRANVREAIALGVSGVAAGAAATATPTGQLPTGLVNGASQSIPVPSGIVGVSVGTTTGGMVKALFAFLGSQGGTALSAQAVMLLKATVIAAAVTGSSYVGYRVAPTVRGWLQPEASSAAAFAVRDSTGTGQHAAHPITSPREQLAGPARGLPTSKSDNRAMLINADQQESEKARTRILGAGVIPPLQNDSTNADDHTGENELARSAGARASVASATADRTASGNSRLASAPHRARSATTRPSTRARSADRRTGSTPPAERSSLSAELNLLRKARRQLNAGNEAGALTTLEEYGRRFPDGALTPEADLLRARLR